MAETIYIGKRVGRALTLKKVRKNLEEVYGNEKNWKDHFRTEIYPEMEKTLFRHAKKYARTRVGKELESSLVPGARGGQGRGTYAITLRLQGAGAKYGRILNEGGMQKAKGGKSLTIPTQVHLALGGGEKILEMKSLKKGQGFTIDYKGRRTVFEKGAHIPGQGIRPMFILEKNHYVRPTYWARDAIADSMKEFDGFASRKLKEYLEKRAK